LSAQKRVLIIVPNIILVEQTCAELKRYFGDKVSAIGGKAKHKPGSWVYVSTINSAQKVIDLQDVVIVDEFHHSSADSYVETILAATKASHIWGLTASPCRADGLVLGIHAMCGPTVYTKTARWCVDNGYLVPVKLFMVHLTGLGTINDMNVVAPIAYKRMCQHKRVLAAVTKIILSMQAKGIPTLVLFKTEKPGEALTAYLKRHGIETEVAHAEYRKPLNDFRSGATNLLISNSALLGEGLDIRRIGCVIDLTNSSSEALCRQVLGRGLRTNDGKTQLVFFSFVFHGYGHMIRRDDGSQWWLDIYESAGKKRRVVYEELGPVNEIDG
jgi:superfamily II DNA or RNA helicase